MRPMTVEDFDTPEGVRKYLADSVRDHIEQVRMRTIRDYDAEGGGSGFQRIGRGSLGGKGRGLAFFFTRMPDLGLGDSFPDVEFVVPRSVVIATDVFEEFVEDNDLGRFAHEDHNDEEVNRAFLGANFRDVITEEISVMLQQTKWPLAIRSSSLLEDSSHQPFAGVYATYMLANDHPNPEVRLRRLLKLSNSSTHPPTIAGPRRTSQPHPVPSRTSAWRWSFRI